MGEFNEEFNDDNTFENECNCGEKHSGFKNSNEVSLDAQKIIKKIDSLPISSYFMETRKKAKCQSVVSWLEICDEDTINLILQYVKNIRENDGVNEKEQAKLNKSKDLFDNPQSAFDENEDIINKEDDIYSLLTLLLSWENNRFLIPFNLLEPALIALVLYATVEIDRRKGYFKIDGSGTLLSKNTKIELTQKGKDLLGHKK